MNKLSVKLVYSFIVYLSFILFFVLGIFLYQKAYYAVLGRPEELDWLLLIYSSAIISFFAGILGSIAGLVGVLIHFAKRCGLYGRQKTLAVLKQAVSVYLMFVALLLLTAYVVSISHKPCPNCVR